MAGNLPGDPSLNKTARHLGNIHDPEDLDCFARRWYFSRQEVEELSPSRKDGIREEEESYLRTLYCAFIKELGMELKVPQLTIATAMLMCQRFYMRQSHAKNCWQTIATACMFLGCKVEETSRWLNDVVGAGYRLMYKWDPSAPKRIKQKEVFDKQKELIINGERFILATLAFNLNIEHPYKPLVWAVKKLEISDKELAKVAWNFVNDWLCTSTLCLQYKPHYIAAGAILLAAKVREVKLPKGWRMLFDISPKCFEEAFQQMVRLWEQTQQNAQQSMRSKGNAPKTTAKKALSSSDSCTLNGPVASSSSVLKTTKNAELINSVSVSSKCDKKQVSCEIPDSINETSLHSSPVTRKALSGSLLAGTLSGSHNSGISVSMASGVGLNDSVLSKCNEKIACSNDVPDTLKETKVQCQASDCGSADSIVEDCEDQPVREKSDLNLSCKIVSIEGSSSKINLDRIRELRKRKRDMITNRKLLEEQGKEMDSEAWIEMELENGIQLESVSANTDKQRRL